MIGVLVGYSSKILNIRLFVDIHDLSCGSRGTFSKFLCKKYVSAHVSPLVFVQCQLYNGTFKRLSSMSVTAALSDGCSPQHQQRIVGEHRYHPSGPLLVRLVRQTSVGVPQAVEDFSTLSRRIRKLPRRVLRRDSNVNNRLSSTASKPSATKKC